MRCAMFAGGASVASLSSPLLPDLLSCRPLGRQGVIFPGGEYEEEAGRDATGGDEEAVLAARQVVSQGMLPPVAVAMNKCFCMCALYNCKVLHCPHFIYPTIKL